jgi:hypothetical protein
MYSSSKKRALDNMQTWRSPMSRAAIPLAISAISRHLCYKTGR